MPEGESRVPQNGVVRSVNDNDGLTTSWGHLSWLVGEEEMPGAEQTLGVVTIQPALRNPLHLHPNCEELLYVVSGACDHLLGEEMYHLTAGSVIRIPRGVKHWAKCTSEEPLVAVISFSAPDRRAENLEGEEKA